MSTTTVLEPHTIYVAHDRFVCLECAGYTASATGRTIGGSRLVRATDADAREWESYGMGALTCECGAVTHA